jgi:two-component system response regulator
MNSFNEIEILLVEDNPDDARLTLRALERNHLANRVFHVKDGEEALDYIFSRGEYKNIKHQANPKVIFLDLKLPKVSGLEVLREIKKDESTKHIPVVILTSSKEEQDVIESYKLGVNSYIVKPVDFENFMTAISDLGMYWLILNEPPVTHN